MISEGRVDEAHADWTEMFDEAGLTDSSAYRCLLIAQSFVELSEILILQDPEAAREAAKRGHFWASIAAPELTGLAEHLAQRLMDRAKRAQPAAVR